jgi:hypothetical protein
MLDQVGVAFLEGAPIIAELSVLRVSELHWNLDIGGNRFRSFDTGCIDCDRLTSLLMMAAVVDVDRQ